MFEQLKQIETNIFLGRFSLQGQLLIYETTILPALLYNIEAWTNITKTEEEEIEKIQSKALKRIFNLPTSTPYYGILMETGIWTIKAQIIYRKLMFLYNVMHSDENRIIKSIIVNQMRNE